MARESIGSTALGKGIAIPHPRRPIVLPVATSTISVFFLKTPIQFGAVDGQPVHTVFALVAPTVQSHLHLLAAALVRAAGSAVFGDDPPSWNRGRASGTSPPR